MFRSFNSPESRSGKPRGEFHNIVIVDGIRCVDFLLQGSNPTPLNVFAFGKTFFWWRSGRKRHYRPKQSMIGWWSGGINRVRSIDRERRQCGTRKKNRDNSSERVEAFKNKINLY